MDKNLNGAISAALGGNVLKFKSIINKRLDRKVHNFLENKKKEVYKSIFNTKK